MTQATGQSSSLGKEDFLKLLVAQLAHQDPLQPMENTEFVAQLATFSNLEQMMSVNTNLGLLQISQAAMANSQVAGLIGKEVEAKGDMLQLLKQGSTVSVNFDLPVAAQEVTIKIKDMKGNVIRTLQVGSRMAGLNSAAWDGKDSMGNLMPAGTYSVDISAKDKNGNAVNASSHFKGIVSGVTFINGIPLLEVGSTTVQVGDVVAVRQPASGS